MNYSNAGISVVIPTIGRDSLRAALRSVYSQTYPPDEVIVCNDSEHPLDGFDFPNLVVLDVGPRNGGNNARIAGMNAASGKLIALLDDDDTWHENHLEEVLSQVSKLPAGADMWLASSTGQLASGTPYPLRKKRGTESLSNYLFVLRGFTASGKGALPTSSMVFPKKLVDAAPWRADLRFHQDLTWLIDVDRKFPDIHVVQSSLVTVEFGDTPGSVSKSIAVAASVDWAARELLTPSYYRPQEFADFLLTRYPLRSAVAHGTADDVVNVFRSALAVSTPTVFSLTYSLAFVMRHVLRRGARKVSRFSSSIRAKLMK